MRASAQPMPSSLASAATNNQQQTTNSKPPATDAASTPALRASLLSRVKLPQARCVDEDSRSVPTESAPAATRVPGACASTPHPRRYWRATQPRPTCVTTAQHLLPSPLPAPFVLAPPLLARTADFPRFCSPIHATYLDSSPTHVNPGVPRAFGARQPVPELQSL